MAVEERVIAGPKPGPEEVFHLLAMQVEAKLGPFKRQTRLPRPANHTRVDGQFMSTMWLVGVDNVGFRLTWWEKLGLFEMYAWCHDSSRAVMDAAATFRELDVERCRNVLKMVISLG